MPESQCAVPLPVPYLRGRFHFELKTTGGNFLQIGDGTTGWFYSSPHKLYRRGDTLWSLSESMLGPVLANAHLLPFQALAEAAANPLILSLIDSIVAVLRDQRMTIFKVDGGPERGQYHHKKILEAIEHRDARGARDAMRAHLKQVREDSESPARREK